VWEASDPDGDPLRFRVSYSPDGGETWTLLARDLTGDRYVVESFDLFAGGDEAVFRVEATDGVHTASALSARGVVDDGAPTIAILSPAPESTVPLHQPVALRASAWDWEDGADATPDIGWESSRDGALGDGEYVLAQQLSAGEHAITATATDSAGGEASMSVTILVDEEQALPVLEGDDREELLALLRAGPPQPGSGTSPWWWVLFAAVVVGGGAVGGVVVRRRTAARVVAEDRSGP
jgi:hypothetical protein